MESEIKILKTLDQHVILVRELYFRICVVKATPKKLSYPPIVNYLSGNYIKWINSLFYYFSILMSIR